MVRGIVGVIKMLRKEVLRQFKEIPYLMESKTYPDMKKISNFQTIYSLRVLTLPSMCIVLPMTLYYYLRQ